MRACEAVEQGRGVLVAAPTGAGKTIVGEFAVFLALATGRKAFYTTPIKALSNQKYADLVRRHGADNVGLLTGDSSINGEAPVVVMTTEVLRNMMYAGSPTLRGLGFVVMDEVHYLADRFRGAVWEEVIIHLPEDVAGGLAVGDREQRRGVRRLAGRGARRHRGDRLGAPAGAAVAAHDGRPGHLRPVRRRDRDAGPLQRPGRAGRLGPGQPRAAGRAAGLRARHRPARPPGGRRRPAAAGRGKERRGRAQRGTAAAAGAGSAAGRAAPRSSSASTATDCCPAITFIFSRAGCDGAVSQLLSRDVRLIPQVEGDRIRRRVEERVSGLADEDLGVLGYWDFVEGLSRGFAAHHAGMLPTFREIVEELFTDGRIRAVFATETLALGINMPARTVVLEKLVKFNGETHADITPAEYTQLTGRAGRRGIDIEGHAVVLWNRGLDPLAVGGLASTRTYPLRSSFRPTYNMAVNLVPQVGRETAREILETSFAQFQADRAVVGMARTVRRNEEALEGYAEAMTCHLGDFPSYAAIRNSIRDLEKEGAKARSASRRAEAELSLEELRPGDIIRIPAGRRSGYAVVIQGNRGGKGEGAAPTVLTADGQVRRLTLVDVPTPVEPITHVRHPQGVQRPQRQVAARPRRHACGSKVPHDPPPEPAREDRRRAARTSGSPSCAARCGPTPATSAPTARTTPAGPSGGGGCGARPTASQRKVAGRTNSVARTFDRICDLLAEMGYLSADGTEVTAGGGDAAPALHREGPAGGRVPAPRRLEPARPRRARRGRVHAGPRAAQATRARSPPGCRATRCPRPTRRWCGSGATWRTASTPTRCRSPGSRTAGWPG